MFLQLVVDVWLVRFGSLLPAPWLLPLLSVLPMITSFYWLSLFCLFCLCGLQFAFERNDYATKDDL